MATQEHCDCDEVKQLRERVAELERQVRIGSDVVVTYRKSLDVANFNNAQMAALIKNISPSEAG